MLKQEPGTVKGLLTGSADVAGRLIFICRQRKNTVIRSENACDSNFLNWYIYNAL